MPPPRHSVAAENGPRRGVILNGVNRFFSVLLDVLHQERGMSEPRWEFEKANPRSVRRDPFEAEFFTGEEENEEVFGRTDSLVREAIQNSLDARIDDRPAEVRFALSHSETAVPTAR